MSVEPELRIEPGSLRKLVQASRTWDTVARREMRQGLRAAALQGATAAQAEVQGPPPGGGSVKRVSRGKWTNARGKTKSRGLRSGLAAGVKVSIRTGRENKQGDVTGEGVRVTTTGSALPPDQAPMVKAYMAKEFRHPVFGNKRKYVTQKGKNWFYRPLYAGREEYQRAVIDAIEKAARAIASD